MLCFLLPYNVLLLPLCLEREAGVNRCHHVQNGLCFWNPHTLFCSVLKLAKASAYNLLHVMQQYCLYTTDVAFTALENKQYCVRLEHENGDASPGFAAEICLEYKLPERITEHIQYKHKITLICFILKGWEFIQISWLNSALQVLNSILIYL